MKKRIKRKKAYKKYIKTYSTGYEENVGNPELKERSFSYLKEETVLET